MPNYGYNQGLYPASPAAPSGSLTDFDVQAAELARRRRLAELLQQQSMNTQFVNPRARGSILAPLAQMFQAYAGKSMTDEANQQEQELQGQRSQALSKLIADMPTADIPARPENVPTEVEGQAMGPILPAQPAQSLSQQLLPWAMKMGQTGGPFGQRIAEDVTKAAITNMLPKATAGKKYIVTGSGDVLEEGTGQFLPPGPVATLSAENKQAQVAATADAKAAALAQQAEIAKQRSEDMRLSIAQRREASQQHADLMRESIRARAGIGSAEGGVPGGIGSQILQDKDTGQKYVVNNRSGAAWKFDDDSGKYESISPNAVPKTAVRLGGIGAMGARESVFTQRQLLAASEATRDLENVASLPISVSTGIFGGRKQGPSLFEAGKETLANTMTSQEVQAYNTMATGFQRALATIEAAGLMPSGSLTHQMDAVIAKEGDSNLTKLSKLAQTRQIVEAGIDVMVNNPRVSESEKDKAKEFLKRMEKAVPFTQQDVIQLMKSGKNTASMRDIMVKHKEKSEGMPEFASEADAAAAEAAGTLRKGTRVKINGVPGTWN